MTSDMTWQARGARPQPLEAAREAARRSGMSVGEWLDSVILQSARQEGATPSRRSDDDRRQETAEDRRREVATPREAATPREGASPREPLAEVNARLNTLSQQLDRLASTSAAIGVPAKARSDDAMPNQIASALSQLDHRLDQLIERRPRAGEGERAATASRRASPAEPPTARPAPATTASPLDQALAEIAERQRMLDGEGARSELARAPTQGYGGLEQQLRNINSQIESLKPIDGAVETLRDDLAEIGLLIKDAMPRQAIEALETEVRSLAQRIDSKRDAGADAADLAGIERGLGEVRDALRALTPAENLVGFEPTLRAMSRKIDSVAAVAQDPATLQHLEGAIAGLRSVVSNVASNDALARLSEDVRALAARVEQVASFDILATLEQRITVIADALQSRPQADRDMEELEVLIHGLADKIERLQQASADHPNSLIEEQLARLIEKIESSDVRFGQLDKIERALAELLHQIDHQPPQSASGEGAHLPELDTLKRDVQRNQDSIEAVNGTLGQVVVRLSSIETELRGAPTPSQPSEPPPGPIPDMYVPAAQANDVQTNAVQVVGPTPMPPAPAAASPAHTNYARASEWAPIEPDLPPDHPLEPNHRHSPAERIAASQAALGAPLAATRASGNADADAKANFIAAARRAAQAASSQLTERPERRAPELVRRAHSDDQLPNNALGGHARFLLIAASVVMVVLGSLQLFSGFLGGFLSSSEGPAVVVPQDSTATVPNSTPPAKLEAAPAIPAGRQTGLMPIDEILAAPNAGMLPPPDLPMPVSASPDPAAPRDRMVTGSVRQPSAPATQPPPAERATDTDKLPASITGGLRAAASKGDPAAEFEVAVRFAEGRGTPQNFAAAADWFERAAKHGVTDSQYNLGVLYARGIGVETNLAEAYKWFALAAREGDRDSAKKRDELGTRLDQATAAAAHVAVRTWVAETQPEAATQVRTPAGGWDGAPAPGPAQAKRRVPSDTKAAPDAKAPRATP